MILSRARASNAPISLLSLVLPLALAASAPADAQQITKLTGLRLSYPTYTPGGLILYEAMVSGSWDIYTMPAEAMDESRTGIRRLTDGAGIERMPNMSPDGRWIAYISDAGGNYDVWRMKVDGSDRVRLTATEAPEIHPYWTPDSRIVFNRQVLGERRYDIMVMDADGGNVQVLLHDDDLNSYAQVSPDGRRLVFDKWWENDETNGEIVVMDLATGALQRLTHNSVYDGYPTWFPDSRHVLYSSEVDGVFKLFRLDVETGDREQLTFGPGDDQRGDVSSDGTRVVFNRTIDRSVEIYEMVLEPGG